MEITRTTQVEDCIMRAIIFIGLQASGKSTFYKKYFNNITHINLDTLKTRKKEKQLLEECIQKGKDFVIDNTNPKKEDRKRYIESAKSAGYRIIGYYFQSEITSCIERNNQRDGKACIPSIAIASTYNKMELPVYTEGFDELYYVKIADDGFNIERWSDESEV